MPLIEVYTGTNCGAWVLRFGRDTVVAVPPWLLEELPQGIRRPKPVPWLHSTAFWGGAAERLRWAKTLVPNRGGALVVIEDSTERLSITSGEVAALLLLVDARIAA